MNDNRISLHPTALAAENKVTSVRHKPHDERTELDHRVFHALQTIDLTVGSKTGKYYDDYVKEQKKTGNPLPVNESLVREWLAYSFWNSRNSSMIHVDPSTRGLRRYTEKQLHHFFADFGWPVNVRDLDLEDDDAEDLDKRLRQTYLRVLMRQQALALAMHRSPLVFEPQTELRPEHEELKLTLPLPQLPKHPGEVIPDGESIDLSIVRDFREHFPQLDTFLDWVVAGYFATVTKKSYCWIHAPSDWGKSVLLGLVSNVFVSVEQDQVPDLAKGRLSGIDPADFMGKCGLAVDEVQRIDRSTKRLDVEVTMNAKFKMQRRIPVGNKLFCSADNVGSLVGDAVAGTEKQTANRFFVFQINRDALSLQDRDKWQEVGGDHYLLHLRTYVQRELHRMFRDNRERVRRSGPLPIVKESNDLILRLHDQYGVRRLYGDVDQNIFEIGMSICGWFRRLAEKGREGDAMGRTLRGDEKLCFENYHYSKKYGVDVMLNPEAVIRAWVKSEISDASAQVGVLHEVHNIIEQIDLKVSAPVQNGRNCIRWKVKGSLKRGIALPNYANSEEEDGEYEED